MRKKSRSSCPVSYCLDIFGDKWTLLILRDLLVSQKRYYGDFLNSGEGISTNILADRLQHLVKEGFATKADDPRNKSYTIYTPTQKTFELLPILFEMTKWGLKYEPGTRVLIPGTDQTTRDPERLKREMMSRLAP